MTPPGTSSTFTLTLVRGSSIQDTAGAAPTGTRVAVSLRSTSSGFTQIQDLMTPDTLGTRAFLTVKTLLAMTASPNNRR